MCLNSKLYLSLHPRCDNTNLKFHFSATALNYTKVSLHILLIQCPWLERWCLTRKIVMLYYNNTDCITDVEAVHTQSTALCIFINLRMVNKRPGSD